MGAVLVNLTLTDLAKFNVSKEHGEICINIFLNIVHSAVIYKYQNLHTKAVEDLNDVRDSISHRQSWNESR